MGPSTAQQTPWFYVLDEPIKLIVADDDPILREFATVYLSSPTATVETVADGTAAWASLTSGNFDVALLDIEMPGIDGFSLLEKIRVEPRLSQLPVMMLTGIEDIASVDRADSLGANSFVTKPVNWRLLTYRVRDVLRTSRIERELRQARSAAEMREAAHSRALLAIEVECRDLLRAILRHADNIAAGSTQADVQQIKALAASALESWDEAKVGASDRADALNGAQERLREMVDA